MSSPSEALTEQFYTWEKRGRGWQLYEYPVNLEPPFRPFYGHFLKPTSKRDDGQRQTLLGGLFKALRGDAPSASVDEDTAFEIEEPEAELFIYSAPLIEIEMGTPRDLKISHERVVQMINRLGAAAEPISFEVIGTPESISVQMVCAESDRREMIQQIGAYLPELALREADRTLRDKWEAAGPDAIAVDFGLSREFMLPLRTVRDFDIDPLSSFVAALAELEEREIALLQVIFEPIRNPWPDSAIRAVTDGGGKPFFPDAPQLVSLGKEKIAQALYAAVMRVAARAGSSRRALEIARGVGAGVLQFGHPGGNDLIPLANDDYPDDQHIANILGRVSQRGGMLLNIDELVSVVHPPSSSVRCAKLRRVDKRTKAAPDSVLGHRLVLGENHHAGKLRIVTLDAAQRMRHTHLIGASGTGKSTLLLNCITQDMANGEGLAVFDPHGDLIDEILLRIPVSRVKDVILFDPADEEYAVGFNMLDAHSELEKTLLASDLVSVFRRLSTSWGDQMTSVLGNGILAFLESSRGGTLADLRRFLVDPEFRRSFLPTVRDAEIVYYWEKEFPLLAGRPQAPILTRLDTFLRPRLIRQMVSQRKNRLDCTAIMNEGKILLAKLAQGAIGEENSYLLGSILVAKFHQMALARQSLREETRRDFYLYIDEFHNFITPSLASILSGARKYRLGLTLAHQELQQLASRDADVASAVLANAGTRICFRVGDADARKLEEGFAFFEAKDLRNLGLGEAICRVERADDDFNLRTTPPAEPPPGANECARAILAHSRERYATKREAEVTPGGEHAPPLTGATQPSRAPVRQRSGDDETARRAPEQKATVSGLGGRGGAQHTYLQELIRRWAEGRGYRVEIEKPVLDGLGIVDVVIEKIGRKPIACEISVTTTPEHELANAQKCLAAGFEHVFLVAPDHETLTRVRARAAKTLHGAQMKKVQFVLPEEIFASISVLESRTTLPEPVADGSKEVLTAKEVEALIRIDVKTIYNYVQRGLIPYVRIQSNLRFQKSDILAWVAEHRAGKHKR